MLLTVANFIVFCEHLLYQQGSFVMLYGVEVVSS